MNEQQLEESVIRKIRKLRSEMGTVINNALENNRVIEIMLNSDGKLWIEELGKPMQDAGYMSRVNAESMINTIADTLDTIVNKQNPILEGELIIDGSRFEALIPPIVSNPCFSIRKKANLIFTLEDYLDTNSITRQQKVIVERAISNRENILIVGGTGSGKTTLTNAVIEKLSQIAPQDRLVIIEDTAEIQCSVKNTVIMRTSLNVNMLDLLKVTMRMRPDRILVGEVRDSSALALLKAWNTGHPGGIATLHANSARAGLIRLEQLIAEATSTPMQNLISEAVDLIVSIEKEGARRVVKEIIKVKGFKNNEYVIEEI